LKVSSRSRFDRNGPIRLHYIMALVYPSVRTYVLLSIRHTFKAFTGFLSLQKMVCGRMCLGTRKCGRNWPTSFKTL